MISLSVIFFFLISLSQSSFFNVDEFKFGLYDVMIDKKPIMKTKHLPPFTVSLVSTHGQEYWCNLPNETDLLRSQKLAEDAGTKTPPNNTEIHLALTPLYASDCFIQNRGWWTYKFCPGRHIVQYHVDDDSKEEQSITYLGYYESNYDWTASDPKDEERIMRHHSQLYVNGTHCDLSQKARRSTIRYRCSPGIMERLVNVEEPESCVYVVTFETYRVCLHAWLRDVTKPPPIELKCSPALNDTQFQQYQGKEEMKRQKLEENHRRASLVKVTKLAAKMKNEYSRIHILAGRSYRRRDWVQRGIIQPLRQFWKYLDEKLASIQFISTEEAEEAAKRDMEKTKETNDELTGQQTQLEQFEIKLKELKATFDTNPLIDKLESDLAVLRENINMLKISREAQQSLQKFQTFERTHKLELREAIFTYGSDPLYFLTHGMDLQEAVLEYLTEVNKLTTRVSELAQELSKRTSMHSSILWTDKFGKVNQKLVKKEQQYIQKMNKELEEITETQLKLVVNLKQKTHVSASLKRSHFIIGSLLSPEEMSGPLPPPKWRPKDGPKLASQNEEPFDQMDIFDELLNHKMFSSLPNTWHKNLRDKLVSFAKLANDKSSLMDGIKISPLGKMQIQLLQEDGEAVDLENLLESFDGERSAAVPKDADDDSAPVESTKKSESDSSPNESNKETSKESTVSSSKDSSNTPGMIKILFYRSDFNQIDRQKQMANEAGYSFSVSDSEEEN